MSLPLRAVAAAGLAVNAFLHLRVAGDYDGNVATISQGTVFRVEAVIAVLAALAVLATAHRAAAAFALLVSIGSLAAVLLYHYVDLGALGPLPNMYEPTWYTEKTLSAIAEAIAALAAGTALLLRPTRTPATTPEAGQPHGRHAS
ncbi:hypothetical protein [Actinokineospora sp. NBRC 105648]|uniref:hypothetical protein n=1 Tax=Actinokineospora sp. NBRC 105648 TaxID=3032206 RepID=UPI0024A41581|nr:hypothetical protein [Actinokineospora sp. NBRC 105648]GLZ43662.1 hypothetical protein Acsp05_72860 [Actinokineospora sp. NBRC 105648]